MPGPARDATEGSRYRYISFESKDKPYQGDLNTSLPGERGGCCRGRGGSRGRRPGRGRGGSSLYLGPPQPLPEPLQRPLSGTLRVLPLGHRKEALSVLLGTPSWHAAQKPTRAELAF